MSRSPAARVARLEEQRLARALASAEGLMWETARTKGMRYAEVRAHFERIIRFCFGQPVAPDGTIDLVPVARWLAATYGGTTEEFLDEWRPALEDEARRRARGEQGRECRPAAAGH